MTKTHRLEDPVAGLRFAHAARLQLDEILEQLVDSAREVQATQGRLRGLLRAYLEVARADDLDGLLEHVVAAAGALVDARYTALGVVAQGGLVRFIHSGMDAETVRRIGRHPEGKGVLGLLVDRPEPVLLRHIADSVASVGFPEHHPPMTTFLGVPIKVGDLVFGNLYLTDKRDGSEFTADDEELVVALAAAAGIAIENATLLAAGRRRQAGQAALVEATTDLLADATTDDAVRRFVHTAAETLHGAAALAAMPTDDPRTLRVDVAERDYESCAGSLLTVADSLLADAIDQAAPVIADRSRLPYGPLLRDRRTVGQSIAVPVAADRGLVGVLLVSRRPDQEPFDQLDRDLMGAIAAQAGLALRLVEARRDNERLALIADREHVAEELRGRAIQRLFRHGLALQAVADRVRAKDVQDRVQDQIDEVDGIIRDIRDTVLTLPAPDRCGRDQSSGGTESG